MSPLRTVIVIAAGALAILFGPLAPHQIVAAQDAGTDVIRGRVTGPDSLGIENVTVTATSMASQSARTTRTDRNGRYTILFPGGGGDYLMSFAQLGFQPLRFEIKREGDEAVLIADAKLTRAAVTLDPMRVSAQRQRPGRNDANQPDIGGAERALGNNVPVDALGDLAAMAAALPGVTLIPGADGLPNGFSVLGLGPDQNNITLNGLNFDGGQLPRDAFTMTRLSTSSFDPSRGGFSGGQITMRTFGGSNFVNRSLHVTLDQPSLQWTDRAGAQLGQQYTNVQTSGTLQGPLVLDKLFYNTSFQFGRRSSDLQTLLNTDPYTLERIGVSSDSVARLLALMHDAGIPALTSAIPDARRNDNGSLLAGLDFQPNAKHHLGLTANGQWNKSGASMLSSTAVPAHGGEQTSWSGTLQLKHSSYYGFGILNEISAALSTSSSRADAYLDLPDARVRVSSDFVDGTAGVSNLQLGGNAGLPRRSTNRSYQLHDEASWFSSSNQHRIKLTGDVRLDRYTQDQTFNRLGTFSYNSLADFEAGLPSAFTRRLSPRLRSGDAVVTAFSLGDAWRKTRNLQIQYGVRVEANRFTAAPTANASIEEIFGLRNDAVPNEVHLSPRLGFSWNYGTAPQIAGFEGAFRGSRGQIRGGIGEFHNTPGATLIGSAIDNTGLPSGAQQLICVGAAVPVADWSSYAIDAGAVPEQCADGTSGSVFSSSQPNVYLFDPSYRFQRSWRANLGWNGQLPNTPVLKRFRPGVELTYSRNLRQPGSVDLNFDDVQRFALGAEGNRPVYVAPASIVPTTGAIVSRDARISQLFNQVTVQRSDLVSDSRQLTLSLAPVRFSSTFNWSVTYVLSSVRDETRGFGSSTAGSPLQLESARSSGDTRHQFNYNVGWTVKNAVTFSLFGRVQSGTPFTPMVGGDINGDGYGNDRAFVFNPDAIESGDPALANAMRGFLSSAPASARECLSRQLGHVAGRNSCEGPWFTTLNARVGLMSQKLHLPRRMFVTLNFNNPLTGLDAVFHGANNLRGWGQRPFVDPTLFYVRGFDPSAERFTYEVNPRFGDSRLSRNAIRAPFTLTLDVRVNVGPEPERQSLLLMLRQGRGGKGDRLTEQQLKQRFSRGVGNPLDMLLRQRDSLKLTQEQTDSIASFTRQYNAAVDSIWTPIAKYLAALGDKYDADEAYERVRGGQNAMLDVLVRFGPRAKQTLTADQVRKLPPFIAAFLDESAIRQMRPGVNMGMRMGPGG